VIARIWHGTTRASLAEDYFEFLQRSGVPDYASTPGNRGVWVLRAIEQDTAHFLLISHWESVESIKRFAGDDYQKARYYPEDQSYLLEFEEHVRHYDVLFSQGQ
jgi:heme-degrading monooxygenase HmoA